MTDSGNRYFDLDAAGVATPIDVFSPPTLHRGKDGYIDVFRLLEDDARVRGLTFFLSELSPETLPECGPDVVLVLVSDEAFRHRAYWPRLRCVIRTYTAWPRYLDGPPVTRVRALALLHWLYKSIESARSFARACIERRDLALFRCAGRILHVPLGCFFRFRPEVRPVAERATGFAFLGSVGYGADHRRALHRLLTPPKLASRAAMLEALRVHSRRTGDGGTVRTTGDFEDSIRDPAGYAAALQDCRISVCPRGSNPETYRFFESAAAGCVIVCEALPDTWFYADSPAIVIDDWRQLPDLLEELLADPERLQVLSSRTRAHWERRLSERAVANRVTAFLVGGGDT